MTKVIKASGEKEEFSEEKVIDSILRAGIPSNLEPQVLSHVKQKLYDNIKTSEIYHHITEFLGQSSSPYSKSRYGLKQAIMAFGPTGYPFEDFIAKILATLGYQTKTRIILNGTCIAHEIDVLGQHPQNNKRIMVEAKFHNQTGTKTDVHVSLYTYARFQDIRIKNNVDEVWLVTNTKISQDAIAYGECMGMKIIGWNYPEGESLRDLIERSGLSPITALTTLPQSNLKDLLDKGIVLCKDLHGKADLLIGMPEDKKRAIVEEANFVCKTLNYSP